MGSLFVRKTQNRIIVFITVYLSFMLDNILLTVVVPIIPDYLFSHEVIVNAANSSVDLRPASLSPLQSKFEILESENGPLGTLLSSKAFVQLAFTPLVGYMVGIVGYSVTLFIGSCNMLLASILFAYGNSYRTLLLARALHGSSSAAIAVSGMCILATQLSNDLRSRVMPLAFGGIALGVLIGYPLGGASYELLGRSAPFLLISFFIIINIVLQIILLGNQEKDVSAINIKMDCGEYLKLFKDKRIIIISLVICISTSTMSILEVCVPIWLLEKFDPPPSRWQLGAVFIPDSFGYLIGSHLTGILLVQRWRISLCAMTLIGLCCCGLPLANTLSQLAFPHFGLGLGVGTIDAALVPVLSIMVDQKGSSHYGPIYSLQQLSVAIAYSFGPLIAGQSIPVLGFPWLIRIVGFLNLITCPLLIELEPTDADKKDCRGHNSLRSYSTFE